MENLITKIKVFPIIDYSVRKLCCHPYPNHPKGCPNFNTRATCPPQALQWEDVYDINLATWLFYSKFNLAEHRERMKEKHPKWSRRQLDCCLYWQPKARKPLNDFVKSECIPGFKTTMCPEAMGINVTETMKQIGVELEWPPVIWTYQVAMGGWLI